MTQGDFGYYGVWTNIINFVEDLDIDAIKKQARIESVGSHQPIKSWDKAKQ
jgi:hypothetical protein